jgi:hypothetical protein
MSVALGPLPESADVRLTIAVSKSLKSLLDLYCEHFAQTWGESPPPAAATLIPHMLEEFMRRDRRFKLIVREQRRARRQKKA